MLQLHAVVHLICRLFVEFPYILYCFEIVPVLLFRTRLNTLKLSWSNLTVASKCMRFVFMMPHACS